MLDAQRFLAVLTVVLGTAGVTTLVFQRLHQPVVLGYVLAGLIVGPHIPIPLNADHATVQILSELGVILLMFSLGLEFSLRKLLDVGPRAGLTALVETSLMLWLGYLVGQACGWTVRESLFTGAIVAISSTTIVAKAFAENGVSGSLRELVIGVLIVEDLIAILLMTFLTALVSSAGLSAGGLAAEGGKLVGFLAGVLLIGRLIVPPAIVAIARLERTETLLVASIGLCFGLSLLAHEFGYSVALGAFLAGSLVAESGEQGAVARLIEPVRDMFAAIFFVSVGMLIDPSVIVAHAGAIAALSALVIVGKICGVSLGAFASGNGTRTSLRAGMSLAQIGEFSFIIAALGSSLSASRDFLYPVAAAVSAITTLTTPWLIRGSGPAASLAARLMPRSFERATTTYTAWFQQLTAAPTSPRALTAGASEVSPKPAPVRAKALARRLARLGDQTPFQLGSDRLRSARAWPRSTCAASPARP
jgi:CPA2 family monovalent cation:H+ antiporter-2